MQPSLLDDCGTLLVVVVEVIRRTLPHGCPLLLETISETNKGVGMFEVNK